MSDYYSKYIKEWAEALDLDENSGPWEIVEHLVNAVKNYDTAVAVMFDKSWKLHREYLRKASDTLRDFITQYPDGDFNAAYLYEWMQAYIQENGE